MNNKGAASRILKQYPKGIPLLFIIHRHSDFIIHYRGFFVLFNFGRAAFTDENYRRFTANPVYNGWDYDYLVAQAGLVH